MKYKKLLENQSFRFATKRRGNLQISDTVYIDYLDTYNGGYYFENSIHLYGLNANDEWNDLFYVNEIFRTHFGELIDEIFCFGEDIFGNQFAFRNGQVIYFNIESGEIESLATNFKNWLAVLFADLNYLSGRELTIDMENNKVDDLRNGFRLCPKYPFIMGGNYDLDNLYLKFYTENFNYNSSVAKQVINLEDGQEVKLKVLNPNSSK